MTGAGSTPSRHGAFWIALGIAVVVVLIDQLSKVWAVAALADGRVVDVIGDAVRFQLAYNTGGAFSTGSGVTWIFTIVSGVAAVALAVFAWRVTSPGWAIGIGALLGGAVSHFGDRLLRGASLGNGHVVDFIDYFGWFIGNVADIAIVLSVVYLFMLALRKVPTRHDAHPQPEEPADAEES
ncbi:signal peptidase II [Microbacterium sp.]|uniref:signal peptidase II n=1 Tax=Microbacterium sp. TaxID=51671 RepID=UPI00333E6BEC